MILIGISKLVKAVGLLALGIGLHYFFAEDTRQRLTDYVDWARLDPHNHYLYLGIEKMLSISIAKLQLLRIGFYVYAALYAIEGVGLLMDKKWAEWLTILTTAGFIPLELYEIHHHMTLGKCAIFVLNVIIVAVAE